MYNVVRLFYFWCDRHHLYIPISTFVGWNKIVILILLLLQTLYLLDLPSRIRNQSISKHKYIHHIYRQLRWQRWLMIICTCAMLLYAYLLLLVYDNHHFRQARTFNNKMNYIQRCTLCNKRTHYRWKRSYRKNDIITFYGTL